MEKRKVAISQSLMKDLQAYFKGEECGLVLKGNYIDDVEMYSSDAMKLGQYFEYMATGQLPRNKQIPEPDVTAKGKLTAPYERAYASAIFAKTLFDKMGIEITATGEKISYGDAQGTLDIRGKVNERNAIIDLKYTGLLDNKWDERGWSFDTLDQKDKLLIQAVHYKHICEGHFGEEYDFYFFLFSSSNPMDVRVAKIEVDHVRTLKHIEDIKKAKEIWERMVETNNFKAKGNLLKCSECALNKNCPEIVLLPIIKTIHY
jgi:hypothetical protein